MSFERERLEAIRAGHRALDSLQLAHRDLKTARNLGIFDLLGSRNMLLGMVKQGKLQNAQLHINQARNDLDSFSRELRDVSDRLELTVNISDFLSFADIFMDNVFVDWAVQQKISHAYSQVDQAIRRVRDVLYTLEHM